MSFFTERGSFPVKGRTQPVASRTVEKMHDRKGWLVAMGWLMWCPAACQNGFPARNRVKASHSRRGECRKLPESAGIDPGAAGWMVTVRTAERRAGADAQPAFGNPDPKRTDSARDHDRLRRSGRSGPTVRRACADSRRRTEGCQADPKKSGRWKVLRPPRVRPVAAAGKLSRRRFRMSCRRQLMQVKK